MKIKNDLPMILANSVLVTLLLSAVIGLTGCKEEGPAEKAGKQLDQAVEKSNERVEVVSDQIKKNVEDTDEAIGHKSESVGEFIDDAAITAKVKSDMVADPLISASKIDVTTDKGVVKLSGVVNDQQAQRALEIARGIKGIKSVESYLVATPVETK
jgi:hyperosmotically inducible protein